LKVYPQITQISPIGAPPSLAPTMQLSGPYRAPSARKENPSAGASILAPGKSAQSA